MSYSTDVSVRFCRPKTEVYEVLCQLGRYPEWNQDMTYISNTGKMTEGLHYRTRSRVAGRVNSAEIDVVRMVPDREIELSSKTGFITFNATFQLSEAEAGGTDVTCYLEFQFKNFILDLAHPVIEAMARDRIRHDLEALEALLCLET